MDMESVWSAGCTLPRREPLNENLSADVVVIGAGMAGILTAYLLSTQGARTIVLEAAETAGGMTKNTTAKITSQHDLIYSRLLSDVGKEKASQYAGANQKAIGEFKEIIEKNGIDCGFEIKPAYVYSLDDSEKIKDEVKAAQMFGIDAEYVTTTELPFEVSGAVRFSGQAQFHPLKFLRPLSEKLKIYENTMVREIKDHIVVTDLNQVQAKAVVVATHYPFINVPGYYFMRMHQDRSYAVAFENAPTLDGMYIDADKNGYSFRNYEDLLILGGGSHRTGENREGGIYEGLKKQAKEWYPAAAERYLWSAQDCMPVDGIPYIGRYSESMPDVYVATGFQKWGMTSSMVSAMILSDMITGKENRFSEVFSPQRFHVKASMKNLAVDGAKSVSGLAAGLFKIPAEHLENIEKGHGGVVEYDGRKVGVYKNEAGETFAVSTKCPHLGCELSWNPDERTWECPCHGSRFDYRGNLMNNPAMRGLASE